MHQRLLSIRIRNELTDEISKAWSGMTTRRYKGYKGLKKDNLRDNMRNLELGREMGRPVISAENAKTMKLITDVIEGVKELEGKEEDN